MSTTAWMQEVEQRREQLPRSGSFSGRFARCAPETPVFASAQTSLLRPTGLVITRV
ncbi:MAG TPA: hypothetical protein VIF37_14580 [Methylobacter sp.]